MFPKEEPIEVQEVICRVMEYLVENPDAKDTLEGIERWWLGVGKRTPSRDLVRRAVKSLLGAGWMIQDSLGERLVVYGVSELGVREGTTYLNQVQQSFE